MKPVKLHLLALLGAALLAALPPAARAADNNPPTQLTYQGFLTDPNGAPLGNASPVNKTIQFRIFAAESGGTALWASSQVVTVDKGHFSVLLGQGSAVGSEPFFADLSSLFTGTGASDRYVELTVDGAALAPRLRFLPAPYAMLARKAMSVDSTASLVATQIPNLDASKITTGTLDAARLPGTVVQTSAGKVGIGTTSPLTVLHVQAGGGTDTEISLSNNSDPANARRWSLQASHTGRDFGDGAFKIVDRTVPAARLEITKDGNVGIGTTAAGKKLDVNGSARIGGHFIFNAPDAVINWANGGSLFFRGNVTQGDENSYNATTEKMVIKPSGNVGIATVAPTEKLHVGGNVKATAFIGDGAQLTGLPRVKVTEVLPYDGSAFPRSGSFTCSAGTTVSMFVSASILGPHTGQRGIEVFVDGVSKGTLTIYIGGNLDNHPIALPPRTFVLTGLAAGPHTVQLKVYQGATAGGGDKPSQVVVTEYP